MPCSATAAHPGPSSSRFSAGAEQVPITGTVSPRWCCTGTSSDPPRPSTPGSPMRAWTQPPAAPVWPCPALRRHGRPPGCRHCGYWPKSSTSQWQRSTGGQATGPAPWYPRNTQMTRMTRTSNPVTPLSNCARTTTAPRSPTSVHNEPQSHRQPAPSAISNCPAVASDMPPSIAVLEDRGLSCAGERLLIKGVRDQFADREQHSPVLEHFLNIQVERLLCRITARDGGWTSAHECGIPPVLTDPRELLLDSKEGYAG